MITALLVAMAAPTGAADEPYVEVTEIAGVVTGGAWQVTVPVEGCVIGPLEVGYDKSCGGFGNGVGLIANVTADVQTIVAELVWDENEVVPGTRLQLDAVCPEVPRTSDGAVLDPEHPCYRAGHGASPLQVRFDHVELTSGEFDPLGLWDVRVFPHTFGSGDGVGAAYEQSYRLYVSLFHGVEAPDGYTAIP